MESLTSLFNVAGTIGYYAAWGVTAITTAGLGYIGMFKGPRQLTPENGTARVITARRWPKFWEKDKIVAREGPEMYVKWGASNVDDIPLETFRVPVRRSGKDAALILKDKVKAQVDAEFFVRVDSSKNESIIQAMEALGGKIDEKKINDYCLPKFDAALRAAAAELEVDQVQSEREQFREAVKKGLDSLKDDGLILVDVALRQLDQSPLTDFDLNNYFDAQGYEKVVKTTEAARKKINDEKQNAETQIASRNKDEAKLRFNIEKEQKAAELAKNEEIAQLEATNREQIAQYEASSRQKAEAARIAADREVALKEVNKKRDIEVAEEERQRQTEEARINRSKAVELADADKKIALHGKTIEEAEAEKAASLKKAEAVKAEEEVATTREVAVAERQKQLEIIEASKQAEAVVIEAEAKKTADSLEAEGAYQKAHFAAKGESDLNEALNSLDADTMEYLATVKRIELTPEIVREAMRMVEKVNGINITSLNGMPGVFNGNAGAANSNGQLSLPGVGGGSDLASQLAAAILSLKMADPLVNKMTEALGGDAGFGTSGAFKKAKETLDLGTPPAPPKEVIAPKSEGGGAAPAP